MSFTYYAKENKMNNFKNLELDDIKDIAPLYMDYFNRFEEAIWTLDNVTKRLRQLINREDQVGILYHNQDYIIGFACGQLTQFDDGIVFELNEIFIRAEEQSKGKGSLLLKEIEKKAKDNGAFRIQLITGVDDRHHHFYNELHNYGDGKNNTQKSKAL